MFTLRMMMMMMIILFFLVWICLVISCCAFFPVLLIFVSIKRSAVKTICEVTWTVSGWGIVNLSPLTHSPHCRLVYLRQMEISLSNQIVILDEAHNIEDSSREAASFSVSQSQLLDAMQDLETIGVLIFPPNSYKLSVTIYILISYISSVTF